MMIRRPRAYYQSVLEDKMCSERSSRDGDVYYFGFCFTVD